MKKLSILLAVIAMAIVSTVIVSCGDKDETVVNPGTVTTEYPKYVHITLGTGTLTDSQSDEIMSNLTAFFKQKVTSSVTVVCDGRKVSFTIGDETGYTNLQKTLKSISNAELDEVIMKTADVHYLTLACTMGGQTVLDYTFEPRVALVGTWTSADGNISITITNEAYPTDKDCVKATLTINGEPFEGSMGHTGFSFSFESTKKFLRSDGTEHPHMLGGDFSYDTKTITGSYSYQTKGGSTPQAVNCVLTKEADK